MNDRSPGSKEANRAYFEELGVLELLEDVRKHFPGSWMELEDKKTGKVIKGRLGGKE